MTKYGEIIKDYIAETYQHIDKSDDLDDVLVWIFNKRFFFSSEAKDVVSSFLTNNELKAYLEIAWKYMIEQYGLRRFKENREKERRRVEEELANSVPSEEFEKACKSYQAFLKYIPADSEEAAALDRIWSCRVVQYSKLVQYKNPAVYHIPMGGMNKK